jgi:phospholipase C
VSDKEKPSRRELLARLGRTAGGVALARYLAACASEDEAAHAGDYTPGFDAAQRRDPDAGDPDAGLPDAAAEPDAAVPDAAPAPDAAPPPVDLAPVRGDGSHPFHYIDTLVIVQLENRSFDHMFGSLRLLEGREDVDGLTPDMVNPDREGNPVRPALLPPEAVVVDPDVPHGRGACLRQWNDGANDGFVREWAERLSPADQRKLDWVMGYYARDTLPVHYALADGFALCQRWHASLLTSTWPNRYYSHCASSGGIWHNNALIDEPTPYPLLAAAGLNYRTYYTNLYFTLTINSLRDKRAVKADKFFEDAAAGTLPNVSVLEPAFFVNDNHPPADVRMGEAFLGSVYEALRQSPQWDRCLLVIFYDEHGGFFDHVPPPAAEGDAREAEGFGQLGFRVPGLVVGPLAKRGFVSSTVFDHSSVPSLISNVFGLDHVNERSRRAGDLAEVLDLRYVRGAERPVPMPIEPVPIPVEAFERAMHADANQPELQRWMRQAGMAHHDSLPERRRVIRRYLHHATKLGAIKLV